MRIFDGMAEAAKREVSLAAAVAQHVAEGKQTPSIVSIVFNEDAGSLLYARLKAEAATRVGIGYKIFTFSIRDLLKFPLQTLTEVNADTTITGVMIQKPAKATYELVMGVSQSPASLGQGSGMPFSAWWNTLVSAISSEKDVDGLHPSLLPAIKNGTFHQDHRVLPATAQAVLEVLRQADPKFLHRRIAIIGRSDLMGTPLQAFLSMQGADVQLFGKKELAQLLDTTEKLTAFDVVISATGQPNLIRGDMLKPGCILLDVGEPRGDVDRTSLNDKPSFLSPVPGGIGPMTVELLLENALQLCQKAE